MTPRADKPEGPMRTGPVAYIMKRYPRLTETFILNEIRAMERMGADLRIFSLLQPEPPPHHPMVAEVKASVQAAPVLEAASAGRFAAAHVENLARDPGRYLRTLGTALLWSLRSPQPLSTWRQFLRAGFVSAACRREGVVHMHAHFANAPTAVAHFASLMSGIPFSFTAHAKDLYLTPAHVIQKRAAAAQFVATCTSYNARYLGTVAREHAAKVSLVYHGIDLAAFGAAEGADAEAADGPPLILSVGRLVPKKGHDDLIAACALLRDRGLDFRCRIVGEGPLRGALQAQIEALGLEDRVSLAGAMTHADLIGVYRTARLFALAPRIAENGDRDGIPNVIAEAMAIGLPVVSTEVSGIPELVRPGQTGWLAPPGEPAALAERMAEALADPVRAAELAQAARALLESDFDLWRTTRRLHGLIGCSGCAGHGEPAAAPAPAAPLEALA